MELPTSFLVGQVISWPTWETLKLFPLFSFPARALDGQAFQGSQQLHGTVLKTYRIASMTSLSYYTLRSWLNFSNCSGISMTDGKIRKEVLAQNVWYEWPWPSASCYVGTLPFLSSFLLLSSLLLPLFCLTVPFFSFWVSLTELAL